MVGRMVRSHFEGEPALRWGVVSGVRKQERVQNGHTALVVLFVDDLKLPCTVASFDSSEPGVQLLEESPGSCKC